MIKCISHLAITVSDMAASMKFYCEGLGFIHAFDINDNDDKPWIRYLKIGENQFIELFYNRDKNEKLHHFCFEVDDIHATIAAIQAAGVKLTSNPSVGKDHNTQAWVTDPDGNKIELMQLSPESPQAAAIANK